MQRFPPPKGWEASHQLKSRAPSSYNQHNILTQSTLTHWNQTNSTPSKQLTTSFSKLFGDRKTNNRTNCIQIVSQNINGIPVDQMAEKSLLITQYAQAHDQHDIILWQETKIFWPKVPFDSRWDNHFQARTHKAFFVFNTEQPHQSAPIQQGGPL